MKACAAASEHIFYVEDCVAASGNISKFFKEWAAASKRYQCGIASERKCAADFFLC